MEATESNTEFAIEMPDTYRRIFESADLLVSVEVCALRTRFPEAALADAFSDLLRGEPFRNVLILTANVRSATFKLADWCDRMDLKLRKRLGALLIGGSNVWIVEDLKDVPAEVIDRTYMLEAHRLNGDVAKLAFRRTSGRTIVIGNFADRTHWFYEFGRKEGVTLHRITSDVVVKTYKDQEQALDEALKRYDKLLFRRLIGLEDVDLSKHFASFRKFGRERLQIRDKKAEVIAFQTTSVQDHYLAIKRLGRMKARAMGKPARFLVLKPRREGITTIEQGLSYQDTATRSNRMNVTLAHLAESTQRIFRIAKLMHEKDPYAPELKGVGNATRLEFPALNSLFFIGTAGSVGFGRGDTLQRVHGSEVSKWCKGPRQLELVQDLVAGLTEAASHGEVTLETTADGLEWFYNCWQDAKKGLNDWHPIFLPWFISPFNSVPDGLFVEEEIKDTLTEEEVALRSQHKLSYNQIAWRRGKMRELGNLFKQEYPEDDVSCFLTSGTLYFDLDVVQQCLARLVQVKPISSESVPGGRITRWKKYVPGMRCVAGTDTSEGLKGCDENGTLIVEQDTGQHVAQVYGLLSVELQARLGANLCNEYGRALWGIERNNTSGGAVVAKAQEIGYRNLFSFRPERAGFSTDAQTRPVILNRFRDLMNDASFDIMPDGSMRVNLGSPEVMTQCMTFKLQPNGQYAADPGCKDDAVMMAAIANEMREHAGRIPRFSS